MADKNQDSDLEWIYESPSPLDIARLEQLGDRRPVWTHHFTTWQAFKHYIAGVESGKRLSSSEWSAPEEHARAARENLRDRPA